MKFKWFEDRAGEGKKKIRIEDLTSDSSPCEICLAMNGREFTEYIFPMINRRENSYCRYSIPSGSGGGGCTDAERSIIKLSYLNLIKK